MNYSYTNSSSISWIGSRYCLQTHPGIWHLPTFIRDLFSFEGRCASSMWWHLLQFMVWTLSSCI